MTAKPARLVTNWQPLGTAAINLYARALTFDDGQGLIFDGYERGMAESGIAFRSWAPRLARTVSAPFAAGRNHNQAGASNCHSCYGKL